MMGPTGVDDVIKFSVSLEGTVIVTPEFDGELFDESATIEAHLDAVMDELLKLDAEDPSIEASVEEGSVAFSVVVEAPNPVEAVTTASGFLRTAIHAAGGGTPDWPSPYAERWAVRLVRGGSRELVDA
jgi:hypothetical protein